MTNAARATKAAEIARDAPYRLAEAIVEQGGHRAILMVEISTGVCVETFSNGYEQPSAETWAEARGYLRGWIAAREMEALVSEMVSI